MTSAAAQLGSADKAATFAVDALLRRGNLPKAPSGKTAIADSAAQIADGQDDGDLRKIVGEFVGNVFYGTLLRQMDQSTIKGEYMHGGRGEEIFQSQLHMEYAKRLGRAPGDPIADRIYDAMTRGKREAEQRASRTVPTDGQGANNAAATQRSRNSQ
ncbi:MAG: rod-binding protein [Phycisphaerales bacterium]|nr:rod-binding protein [Phycisphaerales bacterium]MCB9862533.1 rod-binding protein [Phycisphaerales bacterium]